MEPTHVTTGITILLCFLFPILIIGTAQLFKRPLDDRTDLQQIFTILRTYTILLRSAHHYTGSFQISEKIGNRKRRIIDCMKRTEEAVYFRKYWYSIFHISPGHSFVQCLIVDDEIFLYPTIVIRNTIRYTTFKLFILVRNINLIQPYYFTCFIFYRCRRCWPYIPYARIRSALDRFRNYFPVLVLFTVINNSLQFDHRLSNRIHTVFKCVIVRTFWTIYFWTRHFTFRKTISLRK